MLRTAAAGRQAAHTPAFEHAQNVGIERQQLLWTDVYAAHSFCHMVAATAAEQVHFVREFACTEWRG